MDSIHQIKQSSNGKIAHELKRASLSITETEILHSNACKAFITKDPKVMDLLRLVDRVAATDITVLITGETGTGKELIARRLHKKSSVRKKSFVPVNCGAIPESLEESELFGHMEGAFTGATYRKKGKFEIAHDGTIFLDEVSETSNSLQVKLLRVLESGEYSPVGSAENMYTNARVIAAANQPHDSLVESGMLRKDFFYRLNLVMIEIPPLRNRICDIPILINHFLQYFGILYEQPSIFVTDEVMRFLMEYNYPGNVRELENIIRSAVITCEEPPITLKEIKELPSKMTRQHATGSTRTLTSFHETKAKTVEEFEKKYLASILRQCEGIVRSAAKLSDLSERNLHLKLKKYGINAKDFKIRQS